MKVKPQEHCCICGCKLHRGGEYATPTVQGRSHANEHHYVAERFYGLSMNRPGDQRAPLFPACPWGVKGQTAVFCYDCHELLLHNPVLLPADLDRFAELVRARGLDEPEKTDSTDKLAGRIKLLQEVIAMGLAAFMNERQGCK